MDLVEHTSRPPLDILYQDDYLVAIDKPSGLLVHRSPIDKRETEFAIQTLRDQIGQRVYTVHRLDKPTSGVLLFALDTETQKHISQQFELRQTHKIYHAICRGHTPDKDVIDYPLAVMRDFKDQQIPDERQAAVTAYKTLAQVELPYPCGRYETSRYSLLELRPSTGRKHQLRRHMKHIYHPIIGDSSHGDNKHNQLFRDQFNNDRLLLKASALTVEHPVTGKPLLIQAPDTDSFSLMANTVFGDSALRNS